MRLRCARSSGLLSTPRKVRGYATLGQPVCCASSRGRSPARLRGGGRVAGRVARVLLELTSQPEAMPHERGTRLKVTRQELSRLAGCSREMVSRVLRVLEERRIVATEGRSLIVFEHGTDA